MTTSANAINSTPIGEVSMAELMAQFELKTTPVRGSIITATVVQVTKTGAFATYGGKADAFIPNDEFGDEPIADGYTGPFSVTGDADENDVVVLSAAMAKPWVELSAAFEAQSPVSLSISRIVRKGDRIAGAQVKYDGRVTGFVPFPLLGIRATEVDHFVGETIEARIKAFEPTERKLTFDRKSLESERIACARETLFATIKPGDVFEATVVSIAKKENNEYGVFVDIGNGVTGLVHRSEIPNAGKQPLSQILRVGQPLPVSLIRIVEDKGRKALSLSAKQMVRNRFIESLQVGSVVEGKIVRQVDYGFFVNLSADAEVDGLLHKSQFDRDANLTVGATISVKVIHRDAAKQVVGLSTRGL